MSKLDNIADTHPWPRFFARYLDFMLIGLVLGLFLRSSLFGIATPSLQNLIFHDNKYIAVMEIYLLVSLIEAFFLSYFGYTPGKWIMKVKVRDLNGRNLTYLSALARSILVSVLGMGLMFGMLLTMPISFIILEETKTTVWDRVAKSRVTQGEIPIMTIVLLTILISALYYAMKSGYSIGNLINLLFF